MSAPSFPAGTYRVVKTYGHAEGLSVCFRQAAAGASHCRFLHGYALSFAFTFICADLDARGWCVDFGGLKPLRAWLHEIFDHTMLVAQDDPLLAQMQALAAADAARLIVLPQVGCESFAALACGWADDFVRSQTGGRVWVERVEVSEHGGNAASFSPARD